LKEAETAVARLDLNAVTRRSFPNRKKQGVGFGEASEVFDDPNAVEENDAAYYSD